MTQATEAPREVLYTCSYVPEEIIVAAGLEPRRFLPEGRPADARVHPNTCGYVKSVLAAALDGEAAAAAGIVIANSCDAMRRLYDLWGGYVRAVPALFLDVPKKADDDSIAMFAAELRALAEALPSAFSARTIDETGLRAAIRTCNEIRVLMGQVFAAQQARHGGGIGTRVFDLCLAGTTHTRKNFAAAIRHFLGQTRSEHRPAKVPRIVITGGLVHRRDVVAAIESAGADVVALDTCIGLRHYQGCVEEDAPDPFAALAKRYLTRPTCARMQGFEERLRWTRHVADESGADAVVFSLQKFCGPCAYDVQFMAEGFHALGIPFLSLEDDYEGSGREQLTGRVEAFVELRQ